ncbi:MAG: HAMP domain-containing protein, partial [Planctomycetaceae bacterium]|nr:HAMP domain-containing protein [Planctomycetaceae bacterium]
MFLTCSIRRKLFFQFALVFLMLLMTTAASIVGLASYRDVVTDLEFSIKDAPRKSDLVAAIDVLFVPLMQQPGYRGKTDLETFAAFQHHQFGIALRRSQDSIRKFLTQLDHLPNQSSINADDYTLLKRRIIDTIAFLEKEHEGGRLIDPKTRAEDVAVYLQQLSALHSFINTIPDPFDVFLPRLSAAEKNLATCLQIVIISGVLAFLLFLGVMGSSNHWIFEPIRELHKAAKRVANGDFQYRAQLNTRDEMNELADVFNLVTSQFYEINQDLDRKVREKTTALIRSERLASVGFLASGVAHEINNPLAVIAGRAGMLLQQEEDLVKRQSLAAIVGQALRIRDMIGDLMTFANPPQPELERFDPVAAVKEVVAQQKTLMLEQQRDQKPEFILSLPESSRELNADPIQFRIVLAEILRNAWHQSTGASQIQVMLERIDNNTESLQLTISNDGRPLTPLEQKH